jgi:16S rRNA (guanine527-N7)-methyltransferase
VFRAALSTAVAYAALLADTGVVRGLIGPREVPRLWDRHLLNCAALGDGVASGLRVCDIGSGAGLPGIALAIRRPDLRVTLVEPLLRRVTFLTEAVAALDLPNVEVVRSRAEQLHGTVEFDVVTSRAVAPLPRLLDWSMPLVRQGGVLLAMKGASAASEVAAARAVLDRHHAADVGVVTYGDGALDPPTTVVRVVAGGPSALGWGGAGRTPTRRSARDPRRGRSRQG